MATYQDINEIAMDLGRTQLDETEFQQESPSNEDDWSTSEEEEEGTTSSLTTAEISEAKFFADNEFHYRKEWPIEIFQTIQRISNTPDIVVFIRNIQSYNSDHRQLSNIQEGIDRFTQEASFAKDEDIPFNPAWDWECETDQPRLLAHPDLDIHWLGRDHLRTALFLAKTGRKREFVNLVRMEQGKYIETQANHTTIDENISKIWENSPYPVKPIEKIQEIAKELEDAIMANWRSSLHLGRLRSEFEWAVQELETKYGTQPLPVKTMTTREPTQQ